MPADRKVRDSEAPPISDLLPGEQKWLGVVIEGLGKIYESDEYQREAYTLHDKTDPGEKYDSQRYWLFEFGGIVLEREGFAYLFTGSAPEDTVTVDIHPVTDAKANQMAGASLQIHSARYVDGYVQMGQFGEIAYYTPSQALRALMDVVTAFSDITGVEFTSPPTASQQS